MSHLPDALLKSLAGVAGFNEESFNAIHHSGEQVVAIRFNDHKYHDGETIFHDMQVSKKIPWTENGYYLKERPAFFLDPLWHAGIYYVQDASSMGLEFVLKNSFDLRQPLRVLDLCAAPGGKSTLIANLLSPESILVSNEVINSRIKILEENVIKWGTGNVITIQNDASDFGRLKDFFDIIVVDAPCSGSGLFRKDPEAIAQWSPDLVALCSKRQKRILADVMPALKENGLLVYATCSFSPEEDEEIADYLAEELHLTNEAVSFDPAWNIVESISPKAQTKGYRFFPDRLEGEGFFLTCFRQPGKNLSHTESNKKKTRYPSTIVELRSAGKKVIAPWIEEANAVNLFVWKNQIWAVPGNNVEEWLLLCAHLNITYVGTSIGRIVNDQLIPDHALAMSSDLLKKEHLVNLPKEEAIKYLRREAIMVTGNQKGWKLAAFNGHPLGWLKGIGSRVNNYYPMNWRIRKRDNS